MNAAVVESFGAPPSYTSFREPDVAAEEVLVHVRAAGFPRIVRGIASGSHYGSSTVTPPFVPGVDGVGTLENGERVYFLAARSPYGSFAERSLTLPSLSIPLPSAIDDVVAAGSANPAMSSWVALTRAHFERGESVFILGATGIAGTLAVQIAKRLGARRVVAAGRNRSVLEGLRELGADEVVPLDAQREAVVSAVRAEMEENGIDVVLDYLWGNSAEVVFEALEGEGLHRAAPRVRYVEIGAAVGPTVTLSGATLRSSGLEILGSGFGSASSRQIMSAVDQFFREAAKAPFTVAIRAAPLRDVERLWDESDERARLVFQL